MNKHENDPRYQTLIDFLAWATTQNKPLILSVQHEVPYAIEALTRYLEDTISAPKSEMPPQPEREPGFVCAGHVWMPDPRLDGSEVCGACLEMRDRPAILGGEGG